MTPAAAQRERAVLWEKVKRRDDAQRVAFRSDGAIFMTTHFSIPASRPDLVRLRRRIITGYRCAQELINKAKSAPPFRTRGLLLAYDKACKQMRADVAQASAAFATTDALLSWLFADARDHVVSESDRPGLDIAVRAIRAEMDHC